MWLALPSLSHAFVPVWVTDRSKCGGGKTVWPAKLYKSWDEILESRDKGEEEPRGPAPKRHQGGAHCTLKESAHQPHGCSSTWAGRGRTMNRELQMNRSRFFFVFFCFLRHKDIAATQEAIDHLTRFFLSSREKISQPGIEPPTSSLRFGYLSTIIQ